MEHHPHEDPQQQRPSKRQRRGEGPIVNQSTPEQLDAVPLPSISHLETTAGSHEMEAAMASVVDGGTLSGLNNLDLHQLQQVYEQVEVDRTEIGAYYRPQVLIQMQNSVSNTPEELEHALLVQTNDYDAKWEEYYQICKEYREKKKDWLILKRDEKLREWADKQRADKKAGRLDVVRKQKLDLLKFHWKEGASWEERYEELRRFKEIHGHCRVPAKTSALGVWVSEQRRYKKKGKLSADRIALLDELGFDWVVSEDRNTIWERHMAELKEYRAKHGHANVPAKNSGSLGVWATEMRRFRRKGKLPPEKIRELDALNFNWMPSGKKYKKEEETDDMTAHIHEMPSPVPHHPEHLPPTHKIGEEDEQHHHIAAAIHHHNQHQHQMKRVDDLEIEEDIEVEEVANGDTSVPLQGVVADDDSK